MEPLGSKQLEHSTFQSRFLDQFFDILRTNQESKMNEKENSLGLTYCNRAWGPHLNQHDVLNYFTDKSNPFYDHTCNNEHLRMRGMPIRELEKMKGIEYILLQAQEPILYVIRKQMRHSPSSVIPLANYYIIAGVIYQAPDLKSIVESRLLNTIHYLQSAFEECFNYARFHPSTDYNWSFDRDPTSGGSSATSSSSKDDPSSAGDSKKDLAQRKEMLITDASDSMRAKYRQSVDALIRDLYFKFPPPEQRPLTLATPTVQTPNNENNQNGINHQQQQNGTTTKTNVGSGTQPNVAIKTEHEDGDNFGGSGIRGNSVSSGSSFSTVKPPSSSSSVNKPGSMGPSLTKKSKLN